MKKFLILFSTTLFFCNYLAAQSLVTQEWVQRFSHSDSIANTAVAVDASGCVYVTGTSATLSLSGENIITIKYTPSGVQQWVAIFDNNGLFSNNVSAGLAVDKNCNVYVTGHIFSNSSCDIVTIKYDSAGTEQWVKKYDSPANKCDLSSGIKVDGAGNVYVSGSSQNNVFGFDFTVLKYATDGTLLWDRQADIATGNGEDRSRALTLDTTANVYVTGQSFLNISPFNPNCATVKYNSSGVLQWAVQFDGAVHGFDDANAIAVDADGNAVITGSSFNAAGNADYITVKYNPNGVQLWANAFNGPGNGNDVARSVVVDTKGNVIVTGGSVGSGTREDYATIQYDKNGNQNWLQRFDGPVSRQDVANAMIADAQDNIYVTGQSTGVGTDFDYTTIKYSAAGIQQWVQRFDGTGDFDQAVSLSLDGNNNVYVTGTSSKIILNDIFTQQLFEFATVKYRQLCDTLVDAGQDRIILQGNSTAIGSLPISSVTYSWTPTTGLDNPNISNPNASPASSTLYVVTVTSTNGCTATDTVKVLVIDQKIISPAQSFIRNDGQVADENGQLVPAIKFTTSNKGVGVFFTPADIRYIFPKFSTVLTASNLPGPFATANTSKDIFLDSIYRMDLAFIGSNPNAQVSGNNQFTAYSNFYYAHQTNGVLNVPEYGEIKYSNIYNNIDLVYHHTTGGLKYNFIVKPGGNPSDIKFRYNGASNVSIVNDGSLFVTNQLGNLSEGIPIAFQGNITPVPCSFSLNAGTISFSLGNYNTADTLIIDPTITWGTYYGGVQIDEGWSIAIDKKDNKLYVCGYTASTTYISTTGTSVHQPTIAGSWDAFLLKFDPAKTNTNGGFGDRIWATYYGGTDDDRALGVAVDNNQDVIICGHTLSQSAIATSGTFKSSFGGALPDAFIAKFNSNGVRQWGTYYGEAGKDIAFDVACDVNNNIYICGYTRSSGMGTTGALQSTFQGNVTGCADFYTWIIGDGFVARFSPDGVTRNWGTYFGGTGNDCLFKIGINNNQGRLSVSGVTSSITLSTTGINALSPIATAHQTVFGGGGTACFDGYLGVFDFSGAYKWGTYYGGSGFDQCGGSAIDDNGNVYVTGQTESTTNIATPGAHQTSRVGDSDVLLAKFNSAGVRQWGTYYGGTSWEVGLGITIGNCNAVFIGGVTNSNNGIVTPGAPQTIISGGVGDAGFLSKFTNNGVRQWGTYYGGGNNWGFPRSAGTLVTDIDINSDEIYTTGYTSSLGFFALCDGTNVIGVNNGYQMCSGDILGLGGGLLNINIPHNDAFIAKYKDDNEVLVPSFTINLSTVCIGTATAFTNTTPPTASSQSYLWDFGDPLSGANNTSTLQNPSHTYSSPGSYDVTLTVTNVCGPSSITQTINIASSCCALTIAYDDALVPDEITTNTTWATNLRLNKTIFINAPNVLTVASGTTIEFGPFGRIIVFPSISETLPGGQLVLLPNSKLTSVTNSSPSCPVMWMGIEVWGNESCSCGGGGIPTGTPCGPAGKVKMTTATIEHAHIGILAGSRFTVTTRAPEGGGIVDVSANSKFNRCAKGIHFGEFPCKNTSKIITGTQFNGGALLDPGYTTGNSYTYPSVANSLYAPANTAGRSGFGIYEFRTNGILIDGGSPSTKNTFDNIEKAIVSIDSRQNIANCSFNNHVFGIYIQNTNTYLAKQRIISANTFKDFVTFGIFIQGGKFDLIQGNEFNPLPSNTDQNINFRGIYATSSSGFKILDNRFNFHTEGVRITNSGLGGGFVGTYTTDFGNLFTGCKTSIKTFSFNPALTIRCNTHDDEDISFPLTYTANWSKSSILSDQGIFSPPVPPSTTWDDKLPAGNEFVTAARNDIQNAFGPSFNYTFHALTPTCVPSLSAVSAPISLLPALVAKNPSTSCIDGCAGSPCVPCCRITKVNTLTNDLAALQTEYAAVLANLDKGQTSLLLNAITGTTSNGQLKDLLLINSPLSDEVLLEFIAKNNTPNGHLKDVMVNNSPVSDAVLPVLEAKLKTITSNGTVKQIREAQINSNVRTLTAIGREISSKDALRQYNLNDAVSFYVMVDSIAKATHLLQQENKNYARQMLFADFLQNNELTNATASLNSFIPVNTEDADWKTLAQLELNIALQGKTLFEMDAAQLQTVRNFANLPSESQARANARAILYLLFYEEFPLDDDITENLRVMNGDDADMNVEETTTNYLSTNFPNPFSSITEVEYVLPENTFFAQIKLYDVTGKELNLYTLSAQKGKLQISARDLSNGIYFYSLEVDGAVIQTRKLVIIKTE